MIKLFSHLRLGLENLLRQSLDFTTEIMPDFEGAMKLVRELKDKKAAPAALEKLTALVGDKALEGVLVQVCALLASKSVDHSHKPYCSRYPKSVYPFCPGRIAFRLGDETM